VAAACREDDVAEEPKFIKYRVTPDRLAMPTYLRCLEGGVGSINERAETAERDRLEEI
jgi:hypothetical protein